LSHDEQRALQDEIGQRSFVKWPKNVFLVCQLLVAKRHQTLPLLCFVLFFYFLLRKFAPISRPKEAKKNVIMLRQYYLLGHEKDFAASIKHSFVKIQEDLSSKLVMEAA
jgi:hypothetical protein